MSKIDLLEYDRNIWGSGKHLLACDEAGYGCFAGSLFVAGVSFSPSKEIPEVLDIVNDSKKLDIALRFSLEPIIKNSCEYWFCLEITADEINKSDNVYWERYRAAERQMKNYDLKNTIVVFDGNQALDLETESECLVKGDSKSFSIACASIIAKTAKDREMLEKDLKFPEYDFKNNKGYHSKKHVAALKKFGMCPEHREKYCRNHL